MQTQKERYQPFIERTAFRRMMIFPSMEIHTRLVSEAIGHVIAETKRNAGSFEPIWFDGGPLDRFDFVTRDDHNYFSFLVCPDPPGIEYRTPKTVDAIFPPGLFAVYARAYPGDDRKHIGRVPLWFQGMFHSTNPMIFRNVASPWAIDPGPYFGRTSAWK